MALFLLIACIIGEYCLNLQQFRNLKQLNMKKVILSIITMLLMALSSFSQHYYPFTFNDWQLWRSPFGCLDLSNGNFLPYTLKTSFNQVKHYNECVMSVYEANMKFGEVTPEDKPFVKFHIYYDDKGRVKEYTREQYGVLGGKDRCIIERKGDLVISELYYSKDNLLGVVKYTYDNLNRLTVVDLIDRNNKIFKKSKYVYGAKGQINRYEYNRDGVEICASNDVMDAKGRLIKQTYNEGGATISESISYNEKGLINKISSSKTYLINGKKDETFKGKLFDSYKYRYDEYGNVTERLSFQCHPLVQKYEWIKCKYSKIEEEDVEVVENTVAYESSGMQQMNLVTTNPDDNYTSFYLTQLMGENSEKWNVISDDLDNNGTKEDLLIAKKEKGNGLVVVGRDSKKLGKPIRHEIPIDEKEINNCIVTVMNHDFDNDGIKEYIIAYRNMGLFINGTVFRWSEPTDNSSVCLIKVGEFSSSSNPIIEGNAIKTQAGLIKLENKTWIYKNQKLELQ